MKKALFGYNVKETDNLFNSMQNHIDVLTGKITNLNAELAAKANNTESDEEAERRIQQLESKIKELEKENSSLKHELTHSKSEAPAETGKKAEHIGKIYLTAYEDAEKIKRGAVAEAEEYIKRFVSYKKEIKQKLVAELAEIRTQQNGMESMLNESVQSIVDALRNLELHSERIKEKIGAIDTDIDSSAVLPKE